jgi:putative transcriptional regulator
VVEIVYHAVIAGASGSPESDERDRWIETRASRNAYVALEMGGTRITNEIRALRFHAEEMTQQDLAERVGVTRQTVGAIEGGKYSPSLEVAFRIAEVFGVPLERVFHYEGDEGAKDRL